MRRNERRSPVRGAGFAAIAAVAAMVGLVPAGAEAGLRLEGDGGAGADVRAFAAGGGGFWAGTRSGVLRGTSLDAAWRLDGLSGKPVSSVAAVGDEVWAATGEELWRRSATGSWTIEALPSSVAFPTTLDVDAAGTLWVGGLGVWRRSGDSWSAAPSPGVGIVTAMLPDPAGLVVGLSTGSAARWNGSGWAALSGGVGFGESIRALASFGGTLWAGTNETLYWWGVGAWVADAPFGGHDVRALTTWGGALRAATADAGVLVRSGSAWTPASTGILPRGVQAFLVSGSELLAGTAGGPVYRFWNGTWHPSAVSPIGAGVAADAFAYPAESAGSQIGAAVGATRGGGAEYLLRSCCLPGEQPVLPRLPDGCGDATAVAPTASAQPDVVVATSCGPYLLNWITASPAGSGLPARAIPTTLAAHGGAVFGGTAESGLWRFDGSSWRTDPVGGNVGTDGVGTGTVQTVRSFGGALWVGMVEGLYARGTGPWAEVSAGLPSAVFVAALAGDASTAFAGLATGGVYRRPAGRAFQKDAAGLNTAPVSSLDLAGGRLWAAAGSRGLAVKRDGGWAPENAGLPPNAAVTVVRGGVNPDSEGAALVVGTDGHGFYRADLFAKARTLPVVLDVVGQGGARFLSELVVGSRAATQRTCTVAFTPSPGFAGEGGDLKPKSATLTLPPGRELRAADALAFLRSLGLPIPVATAASPVAGSVSLRSETPGIVDEAYLVARTYTRGASGGTFGLFYDAPSDLDAAEEAATVYGLRSVAGEARSNLAAVHLPGRGSEPIELSVQVYGQDGVPAGDPLVRSLAPGEWTQWNGVLGLAGLPEGSYGYARVRRTNGIGAFAAYGVVNDARTSDGSYLPAFRPGGRSAVRTLVVPVVLDVAGEAGSRYTTEVTIANDGTIATPVDLVYRPAPGFGTVGGVALVTLELAARQQVTLPDVLAYLRSRGMQIPDGTVAPQAGTLTATFRWLTELDAPATVVLARTSTPNTNAGVGGSFGLFYPAVAKGGGARTTALVPGLAQDEGVRSNLAVVNTGGGSELPITLEARLYDADTGAPAGNPLTVRLAPGDWHQWSRVREEAGAPATVKRFTAVVRRTAGDDTFVAYGVLNDSVTSDGSYQTMITSDPY
ncbi:MAG: hypothetical protein ACYDBY_20455 [Thermoanaerobaculia bacterium]